jgi:glutathione S-transferase
MPLCSLRSATRFQNGTAFLIGTAFMATTLTISSKNYSSWSLRGWLMVKCAAEILLLSSSIRVPSLQHDDIIVWDTLAIGEYVNEINPKAGLLPTDTAARAHCRSICGEMHSGFSSLRAALPMNLKGFFPNFKIWSRAQADIDRIFVIWRECSQKYGGPYLFGKKVCMADLMFAPVVTRFHTYDIKLDEVCAAYCKRILLLPEMQEWIEQAKMEPDDIDELEAEF